MALLPPGAKVSLCANNMLNLFSTSYDELEQERFGLEMLYSSEWAFFYPFKKDKSAMLSHAWDARKTYDVWRHFNKHDAEIYRKLVNFMAPRMADWWQKSRYRPPSEGGSALELAEDLKGCPVLPSDLIKMSPADLVEELFQDDHIKTHFYAMNLLWGIEPVDPGWAIPAVLTGPLTNHILYQNGIARGGPHSLTHALARCFVHYGGSIFTNCPVTKIIVQNGEAKGVVLSKDAVYPEAEITARMGVASDLSPHPTFIDLVGLDKLPQHADAIKAFSYEDVILFTNFWVLNEPLDWSGAGYPKEVSRANAFNFGLDNGIEDAKRLHRDWTAHRLPDPPIVCGLTTQGFCFADPSQAPPGQHMVMSWSHVTYDLDRPGGALAWDDIREDYGDKVEDLLATYVPNIKKAKIARYCETPLGYYRRNPSQIKGHWFAAKIPSQMGVNAPFPGCGAPRTPISKLYIIRYQGTSTMLDAGYRAADALARDVGIRDKQDWWKDKPLQALQKWYKRHNIQPHWTVD